MSTSNLEQLESMLKETYDLKDDLAEIQIWHAKCQGKMYSIFPDTPKVIEYWRSINLEWDPQPPYDINEDSWYDAGGTYDDYQEHYEPDLQPYTGSEQHRLDFCHDLKKICRNSLRECIAVLISNGNPDSLPDPRPNMIDVGFIDDKPLRNLCESRFRDALLCYDNRLYVPGIWILGSVLEGILYALARARHDLSRASKSAPKAKKDPSIVESIDEWGLDGLINVAEDVGWIKSEAKQMGGFLRDYRNLIHPANYLKRNANPDIDTFRVCYSAVQKAITHIKEWLAENPLPKK